MVKKQMDKEVEQATPLISSSGDHVQDGLNDLDQFDSMEPDIQEQEQEEEKEA